MVRRVGGDEVLRAVLPDAADYYVTFGTSALDLEGRYGTPGPLISMIARLRGGAGRDLVVVKSVVLEEALSRGSGNAECVVLQSAEHHGIRAEGALHPEELIRPRCWFIPTSGPWSAVRPNGETQSVPCARR